MRTDTVYVVAPKGSTVEADFYTTGTNDEVVINNAILQAAGNKSIVRLVAGAKYVINPAVGIHMQSGVTFDMARAIVTIPNGANTNGNIVKCESISDFRILGCLIDGNRANQASGTNYGLYVALCSNYSIDDAEANHCRGVGIHIYGATRGSHGVLFGSDNLFHGAEVEQCVLSVFSKIFGVNNLDSGFLVSPGEVSGTGTRYCTFGDIIVSGNAAAGFVQNAANGDVSAYLNEGNLFNNLVTFDNDGPGLVIRKQDRQVFNNVAAANNGEQGVYLNYSQYNIFNNIAFHNNSAKTDGAYDEILIEGASGHYSSHNQFRSGYILIDGDGSTIKRARYGINEASSSDGTNLYAVDIVNAGTVAKTRIQSDTSTPPSATPLPAIDNLVRRTMPDGYAGFDSPFSGVLRVINRMGGETQNINDSAAQTWYHNGVKLLGLEASDTVHLRAKGSTYDPTDNNMYGVWLDEAANALKFRVKYSNGTVKAGSISLT